MFLAIEVDFIMVAWQNIQLGISYIKSRAFYTYYFQANAFKYLKYISDRIESALCESIISGGCARIPFF